MINKPKKGFHISPTWWVNEFTGVVYGTLGWRVTQRSMSGLWTVASPKRSPQNPWSLMKAPRLMSLPHSSFKLFTCRIHWYPTNHLQLGQDEVRLERKDGVVTSASDEELLSTPFLTSEYEQLQNQYKRPHPCLFLYHEHGLKHSIVNISWCVSWAIVTPHTLGWNDCTQCLTDPVFLACLED